MESHGPLHEFLSWQKGACCHASLTTALSEGKRRACPSGLQPSGSMRVSFSTMFYEVNIETPTWTVSDLLLAPKYLTMFSVRGSSRLAVTKTTLPLCWLCAALRAAVKDLSLYNCLGLPISIICVTNRTYERRYNQASRLAFEVIFDLPVHSASNWRLYWLQSSQAVTDQEDNWASP